jgi:hypothetical protein
MAAPATINAVGYFAATRAGSAAGEATLRMKSATRGSLTLGKHTWKLTGNLTKKSFHGTRSGSVLDLKIVNRSHLKGTVDGDTLELQRNVLRPIPSSEKSKSDSGPKGKAKAIIAATPDYATAVGDSTTFWYDFGQVHYRGRLDGSARVMCIASDPGPAECLPFARRTLIGDSGQKAQGFLSKLGLTRSYVMVNAFAVAMHPGKKSTGLKVLKDNVAIRDSRHDLYDRLLDGGALQAIVLFGSVAQQAYDIWAASNSTVQAVPAFRLAHPAAVGLNQTSTDMALKGWAKAITKLRKIVTPDANGEASGPNYGTHFTELDYARIPRWDLPKKAPSYVGDDSWGRAANPRHNNCCARPKPDDGVSLLLNPPEGLGVFLRYAYKEGTLKGAKNAAGKKVAVDSVGLPS